MPTEPLLLQMLGNVLGTELGAQFRLAAPPLAEDPAVAGHQRADCRAEPRRVGGLVSVEESEPPASPARPVNPVGQQLPDRLADRGVIPCEQLIGNKEQACTRASVSWPASAAGDRASFSPAGP